MPQGKGRERMSKQGWLTLVLGIAIGINAVLVASLVGGTDRTAQREAGGASNGWLMSTGIIAGKGNAEALWLYDTNNKKLACYFQNGKTLELLSVRDLQYDYIPQAFGRQDPAVKDMKEGTRGN